MAVPALATLAMLLMMTIEARVSATHEKALRARGATEAPDDVYGAMRIAYPAAFVVMGAEGMWRGLPAGPWIVAGAIVLLAAKALKYWAITALGDRWTFRVLVVPRAPLVTSGPYRHLRHPNYLAVLGEFAGFGTLLGAPIASILTTLGFSVLLRRRIEVEERALEISRDH